ncbi:sec-independent protein translocase protein TatB [Amycolatopsis bartoniae]|uniref:Sec-independent protein translocase protein TatB n=1 Tax=Amycolatopsis bartoniae TaxID=941986 RepID=A0A8H9J5I9_9PSEU|nr:Sec-independent protein translocase protein TatB [Amycolatopsis bartoniae]MBB2937264.1 sec-independent protein translocase protein TatB [Amycolatopsis bartoniae]TVT07908.1 Sec-independent protein translocase subunit TatB [Amycolatopsis bartoniae]GHF77748.1 sec-independent protein translocase protein TatB [Amycolatopsis bartoniae]
MFDSVGWGEILVLIVAGLFILGPERLPEAASWLAKSVRKVREFANGAREQLREEMGPEFDEFRKPLEDLRQLRNFDPRRAITNHLFDGDPDPLGLNGTSGGSTKPNGYPAAAKAEPEALKPGEKPPVDPDAT